MDRARKQLSFLLIGVLVALTMAVPCRALVCDCLSILTNGWGDRRYLTAAVGGDQVALVSVDDTAFRLTIGSLDGKRTDEYSIQLPAAAVVLRGDAAQVVSTAVAVQQEVLSFNEQRMIDGLPTVTLRIAMDAGEVLIGIVGDGAQMEPVTISTCFTTARRLIGLASRLDAGILCTEEIIAGAQNYGSRYVGKSRQGGDRLRIYEIFDGDAYNVRRSKKITGQRFSQGVFTLCSRDFAAAKRIFLELVHDHPQDGGARYYLYLADRMEGQPEQEIVLES